MTTRGIIISGGEEKKTQNISGCVEMLFLTWWRLVSLAVIANPLSWHGEPSHHEALVIVPLWRCATERYHFLTRFYCFKMRSTVCGRDLLKGAPCLIILVVFNWGLECPLESTDTVGEEMEN